MHGCITMRSFGAGVAEPMTNCSECNANHAKLKTRAVMQSVGIDPIMHLEGVVVSG